MSNSKKSNKAETKRVGEAQELPRETEVARQSVEGLEEVKVQDGPKGSTKDKAEEKKAAAEQEPAWDLGVWHEVVLQKIGQPAYVLDGAMVGEDQDKEYTESEVRSLVEKFLNTPAR